MSGENIPKFQRGFKCLCVISSCLPVYINLQSYQKHKEKSLQVFCTKYEILQVTKMLERHVLNFWRNIEVSEDLQNFNF